METAIRTDSLSKQYPGVKAVHDLNLHVHKGEIYGFLGLNGAGKTTTIRSLLGMIKPSSGRIYLLGKEVGGRTKLWNKVGHLVESPAAYPELTVWENLRIASRLQRLRGTQQIEAVITKLGLSQYRKRKAGVLSTGNFQRLGLARAMLHNPELLLLDEPANGLDPAGVVEIREMLKELAHEQGVTVFMSSHILSEVDRLADRIGIIHEGRLIEEYDRQALEKLRAPYLSITVSEPAAAVKVLKAAGHHGTLASGIIQLTDEAAISSPDEVAGKLVHAGHPPSRLTVEAEDLEEHFLRLTGGSR